MRTLPRRSGVVLFASIAIGAGTLLGLAGWPQPNRTLEFSTLILAAILTSALAMPRPTTKDWATMPPSFIIDFVSLLLPGPHATTLVATAGTPTHGLTAPDRSHAIRPTALYTPIVIAGLQASG